MVLAALAALIIVNTNIIPGFHDFWTTTYLQFSIGGFEAHISLEHFINDFLMAFFFLVIGLEIKFEMTAGSLTKPRKALLPIFAAVGGAILPAGIFLAINSGTGFENGWGIPMANDIAFCLGILALLGNRIPLGLRAYLSTLTIVDDIIAILVIAFFYTESLNIWWLLGGLALFGVLMIVNRMHIYDLSVYMVIGLLMWVCFLLSGVHATLAGVLLALTIPAQSQVKLGNVTSWFSTKASTAEERYDPGEHDIEQKEYLNEIRKIGKVSRLSIPPVTRLDHFLHTPVYFIILPLFAFASAGVLVVGTDLLELVTHPVTIGVFFGLLVGKPVGIFLFTLLTVKLKICPLPDGVRWGHIVGVSVLGGVGFTMAIFITNLAFVDPMLIDMAKTAILSASLIAGVTGFLLLRHEAKKDVEVMSDEELKVIREQQDAKDREVDTIEAGIKSSNDVSVESGVVFPKFDESEPRD